MKIVGKLSSERKTATSVWNKNQLRLGATEANGRTDIAATLFRVSASLRAHNGQMTAAEKRRLITIERLTAASGTRAEVTEPLRARHTRGRRCSRGRRHVALPRPVARANR